MVTTTFIMFGVAIILSIIAYFQGAHIEGLKTGGKTLLNILPLLIAGFVVAGMIQVLIPKEFIARWLGKESGFKGIGIGWLVGFLAAMNPYVLFPIIAGFYKTGASAACLITLLTSWGLGTIGRLPIEVSILGPKFTLMRLASVFILPPIAGLLAKTFFS